MENKPIIRLFEENELNIAKLYRCYAEKIPAKKSFWDKLSKEEVSHASDIKKEIFEKEQGLIAENKFSRGIIRHIMDFVAQEISKAEKMQISHKEALHSALRIERSMLEKKCFDIFTPSNETVKHILNRLNNETEKHINILLEEIGKEK